MSRYLPKFLYRLRFRTKITLGVTFMLVFCGLGIGLILSSMSSGALLHEGKKRGMALTSALAFRLAEPILALDFLRMKNLIDNVHTQYGDIQYIFVTDTSANVLAHTFSGGFPTDLLKVNLESRKAQPLRLATEYGSIYDFNVPIILGESNLGTVRLGLSRKEIDAQIQRQRLTNLIATLGVVGIGIVLALLFSRTITSRLNRLRSSVEEIVRGNLDVQAGFPMEKYCWQLINCDRKECPAYGDVRRRCWHTTGSLCPNCPEKESPLLLDDCRHCSVYKSHLGDELQDLAEAFDAMAMTVKKHIEELTEREKTIARQQGLLKTIMNVTPDFITLQDKDLTYIFAGKAFCDFFNLKEEDVVGRTDSEIFPSEQAEQNVFEGRKVLGTGKPLAKEISISRQEEQRWFHVIKIPVYDHDGTIMGVLLTARDISMLKKFQEQLIQSQKMEDLGRLAGGVAHEINTPLGIILGYSQLLMDDIKDEETLEGMKIIEKQTKVCRKIVADLLGFARNSQSVSEPVDINGSIRKVTNMVEHSFFRDSIKIVLELDEDIPTLIGDEAKLKQVWLNLLNNAADAIGKDGSIFVQSRLCPEGLKLEVRVIDTGKGVEKAYLSKVFDPFFTTKEVGKGTGLGLSVSFGIIKDHGGTISVLSPPPAEFLPADLQKGEDSGPGTAFVVELFI